jgi:hypothetical protein
MVSDTLSTKLQEIMTEKSVFVPFIIRCVFLMEKLQSLSKREKTI